MQSVREVYCFRLSRRPRLPGAAPTRRIASGAQPMPAEWQSFSDVRSVGVGMYLASEGGRLHAADANEPLHLDATTAAPFLDPEFCLRWIEQIVIATSDSASARNERESKPRIKAG